MSFSRKRWVPIYTISSTAACYVYVTHNMSAAEEATNFECCLNEVTAGL
jgi:hypothetical protein